MLKKLKINIKKTNPRLHFINEHFRLGDYKNYLNIIFYQ